MGPLHPLSHRLNVDDSTRSTLAPYVQEALGSHDVPVPATFIGEHPVVMSQRLHDDVTARVTMLCDWIRDQHAAGRWRDDPHWGDVGAPDSLCVDLAVVRDDAAADGWGVRWVEFQTFLSISMTVYGLHEAARRHWPELGSLRPWDAAPEFCDDWLAASRAWLAPAAGGALLEHAPRQQITAFDLYASARLWGLDVIDAADVRVHRQALQARVGGAWAAVPHVVNRLILHESPDPAALRGALSRASLSWRNHPAWYYRVNKGVLPELPLPAGERCARADRWRTLGVAAESLVLKASESFGGTDVHLHVSAAQLDALPDAERWIVQPRYEVMPLLHARDGAPLYGELRVMVSLREGRAPWIASRFARMNRGPKTGAKLWNCRPGEGLSPLYPPPVAAVAEVA